MMSHPYRMPALTGETSSSSLTDPPCVLCALRRRLARVRLESVVLGSVALAFLFLNAVGVASAYESMRLTRKLVANLTATQSLAPTATRAHLAAIAPVGPALPVVTRFDATIVVAGPDEYLIAREVEDEALAEIAALMPGTRITPGDGRTDVVAAGIKPNMVVARLGFRNGDDIRSINHVDFGSPEAALEAYARLRNTSDLVVEIQRDGVVRELRYHVL